MNLKTIRVALVDDDHEIHKIVADTLNMVEDIDLIGEGVNGVEAIALCEKLRPDVLLLDVMMPVMDGIEAARKIRGNMPQIKILALSSFQDRETVQAMLQSGVDGYVDKGSLFRKLAPTIRTIHQGEKVFSSEALLSISAPPTPRVKRNFSLSKREMEVLRLMCTGLTKKVIASKLDIKESTVKYHLKKICAKLGVRTRSEALITAAKNRLV